MYYYPNNLKARPLIWLWYLRDLTIISLGCIVAILMLISYFMVVPLVAVVVYGVLTMRIDDTSILDFITQACDYILVQGNADLKDGWVCPRVWTSQKTKTTQAGDLIMSVRAPAGAMGKTAYDAVIGRGVAAIKGNEFLYQSLVKMDEEGYWKKLSCGSTFESINSDNIFNAEIYIPDIDDVNFGTTDHEIR